MIDHTHTKSGTPPRELSRPRMAGSRPCTGLRHRVQNEDGSCSEFSCRPSASIAHPLPDWTWIGLVELVARLSRYSCGAHVGELARLMHQSAATLIEQLVPLQRIGALELERVARDGHLDHGVTVRLNQLHPLVSALLG